MAGWLEQLLQRGLSRAAATLSDEERRQASIAKWFARLRWTTRVFCFSYTVLLAGLWWLLKHVGESNITLAVILYSPQSAWLLPLPVLLVIALIFDFKSVLAVAASALLCVSGLLGYQLGGSSVASHPEQGLTVLTFNRGENGGTSMQPFKNAVKPDILVLQDATARSKGYLESPGYEEFKFGDDTGEFSIVSRYPITSKELIQHNAVPVAARFTLDWNGRAVVLYNVHLPTPRHTLASLKRGAFLWGVLGLVPGTSAAKKKASYEEFFVTQIDITRTIVERAERETQPCLVVGDFNAPAIGFLHHLATRKLRDAHETSGHGCGYTFPGTTHNPLSLGGPWMRLDKLLSNASLEAVSCVAEPDRASQHRAAAATFVLK